MPEKNIKRGCYLKVTLVDRGLTWEIDPLTGVMPPVYLINIT